MAEEPKDKDVQKEEKQEETGQKKPEARTAKPASAAATPPAQAPQPRSRSQAPKPAAAPPRPQNQQSGPANGAPTNQQVGGRHTPPPRPRHQPGDSQRSSGPQQKTGQPTSGKPQIDWLRSKPVSTGGRSPGHRRGLDLGRPDAWSGRQKPPTPGTSQQPGDQGSSTNGPGGRPRQGGQPYRGSRPSGPGGTRSTGGGTFYPGGYTTGRPGGFRTGGYGTGRPPFGTRSGGPPKVWGKGTEQSRRSRSARKSGKQKEKPVHDEDGDNRKARRPDDALRAKGGVMPRTGFAKAGLLKGKLEAGPEVGKATIVPSQLTVRDLADVLNISSVEIIKELMKNGIMAPINQVIDFDTASIVASDLGYEIRQADMPELEVAAPAAVIEPVRKKATLVDDDPSLLKPRPPVVTIMGHVDHGKTTLLDAIRRTNVAEGEFGGITQHIGAYQVEEKDKKITFLDTPGHEAFTAMRARGAQVTDVAVVVVAADDGVQPQTLEAINHARAAGVPIVVALNKVDKETANPERVKQQLSDAGLVPEDWGGNTVVVPVSARKGTGVSDLLDMILLVSEMASLKANPNRAGVGTIIEAEMDKSKGPMATVLVQNGTLKVGSYVVVGPISGKIRAMFNDKGKAVKQATPSMPASILGLSDVPQSGDILQAVATEHEAREQADQERDRREREATVAAPPTMDLEHLSSLIAAGEVKELDIVLKVDVQGSLEPIVNSLKKLGSEKENIEVCLIHEATGMITESDVTLAAAALQSSAAKAAMVIGFNVDADAAAKHNAEVQGIEIRTFKVIYDLVDAIDKAVKGMYEPKYEDRVDGHSEVRQVFKLSKGVTIAGAVVNDGIITRGALVRVKRDDAVIFEGKVDSLRRFKDDVKEVASGFECGIVLDGFNDFAEKDIIETHHKERVN